MTNSILYTVSDNVDDMMGADVNQFSLALSGQADIGAVKAFVPIVAPATAPTAAINLSAGNLTGAYKYVVVFVTGIWHGEQGTGTLIVQGNTGYGVASLSISPASQQVNLTSIPTGPTGTVARIIGRTKAGGNTYYQVTQINDNTTTTYTDNTADGSLTVQLTTTNTTGTEFDLWNLNVSGTATFTNPVNASAFAPTGLTGATAASRYVGATTSGAPTTGTFNKGDWTIDQTGAIWICTTSGTPGTWLKTSSGMATTTAAGTVQIAQAVVAAGTPTAVITNPNGGTLQTILGNFQAWSYQVSGLTGATASSRYVGATASGAPATGTFLVGDWVIDQSGAIWICTTAGTPGTWTQVASPQTVGQATTTTLGTVQISTAPTGSNKPVAVSTTDPKYINGAVLNATQTWTAAQTFNTSLLMGATNTATSSTNYASNQLSFNRSAWNGSAAVTDTSYFYKDPLGVLQYVSETGASVLQLDNAGDVTAAGTVTGTHQSADGRRLPSAIRFWSSF